MGQLQSLYSLGVALDFKTLFEGVFQHLNAAREVFLNLSCEEELSVLGER